MVGLAQNLSFILLGEDRSASKTMTAVEKTATVVTGRVGSAFQKLGGVIGGEFGNVLAEAGGAVEGIGAKAAKLSLGLELGGGAALGAGLALQQFGSEGKAATDQLNAAITASGSATSDYAEEIEKAVRRGEDFDHKAADTKAALTILTEQTGDTGKALKQMSVVTDLAAAKHISLSDAASLVARIMSGSGARTLTQYGIKLDGVGTKTEQGQRALEALSKKLDGQAKASVNNFGSQLDIVKTKISDFAEEVSGPVGGALTALGGVATTVGIVMDIYKAKQTAAAAATLAAAAAAETATVAETELTAETVALDVAMDANPIGAVAAAIGLLAAVAGGVGIAAFVGATKATTDYTSAIEADSGAIGENTRKLAANSLEKDGALAAAARLGIAGTLVVDAALGEKGARKELTDQIHAQVQAMSDQGQVTPETVKQLGLAKIAADVLEQSVGSENVTLGQNKHNLDLVNGALLTYTERANAASAARYAGAAAAYANQSSPSKHAGGGDIMRDQLSLVGENGPEVVRLPGGSHVFPNGQGPTGGGGVTVHVSLAGANVYGQPGAFAKAITTELINTFRGGGPSALEFRRALGLS